MALKIRNSIHIYILSIFTGLVTGCFVILFSKILSYMETLFPFYTFSQNAIISMGIQSQLFFLPILGGLLVGLITHYLCPEAKGNGIDSVLDSFHNNDGVMRGRIAFFKSIATILTLSSGGSGGKEGPAAQIGASIGSKISDLFGGGARARRTMLLAGTSAALGTIFQAPLGGAITAVEMVYKEDIESDALIPSIISSVSAYFLLSFFGIIHREYFSLKELSAIYLPIYPVLGIICFIVGFILVKSTVSLKSLFQNWKIYPPLKPAIGGLICGLIYLFFPVVSGTGEKFVHSFLLEPSTRLLIPQNELLFLIFAVFGLKILATSFTIASGGSGGIFGPSIFLGGTIGMLAAELAGFYYKVDLLHYQSFILVGMGAFYAGVASAPIAAMIMICEMTGSYVLLPPLMICSILVVLLSKKINLYQSQTHNRFHSPAHSWDVQTDVLKTMQVFRYKKYFRHSSVFTINTHFAKIHKLVSDTEEKDFVVVNEDHLYLGMISSQKLLKIKNQKNLLASISTITPILMTQNIGEVLRLMKEKRLDKAPIVDGIGKCMGYLRYHEILELYFEKK